MTEGSVQPAQTSYGDYGFPTMQAAPQAPRQQILGNNGGFGVSGPSAFRKEKVFPDDSSGDDVDE